MKVSQVKGLPQCLTKGVLTSICNGKNQMSIFGKESLNINLKALLKIKELLHNNKIYLQSSHNKTIRLISYPSAIKKIKQNIS